MNYCEIIGQLEEAREEKKRHYDEWRTRQNSFLNASPEWQAHEEARRQYELAKARFFNLKTQYNNDNPPTAYDKSSNDVLALEKVLATFKTEVLRTCEAYRDLILNDVEDGIDKRGDAIVGSSDWTWAGYSLKGFDDKGFCFFDDDGPDSGNFFSSIDITWEEYHNIAMYVALHQQPGDK